MPPLWAPEPKSGLPRLGPPLMPPLTAVAASAHSCGEKWHYSLTLIGNDDADADSDDDDEQEDAISVASEDDKRPETPSRDSARPRRR